MGDPHIIRGGLGRSTAPSLPNGHPPGGESAPRESESFAQSTIDALVSQVCVLDETGNILAVNKAWREFREANRRSSPAGSLETLPLEAADSGNYLEICDRMTGASDSDAAEIAAAIRAILSGQRHSFVREYSFHSGSRQRWYLCKVTRFHSNRLPRAVIEHIDVTGRRHAEEALRVNEERLRMALDVAGMGTFDLDLRTGKRMWSAQMFRIFGLPAHHPQPQEENVLRMCHPEDRAAVAGYIASLQSGLSTSLDYRILRPDAEIRWVESSAAAVRDEDGKPVRVLGIAYDVTDRKRAEARLRRSEDQLRALAGRLQTAAERERLRIARDLHDELGQALTGLKMDLDWIVRKHGGGGYVWVPMIHDAMKVVDSTVALVRRLATELRPPNLDVLGLPAAIEWHVAEFQRHSGIACTVRTFSGPLGLSADQNIAAFRIFQEILTNVARHAQAQNILITFERGRTAATLTVRDDGVGFSADLLEPRCSLGILGMRERAMILGADLTIQSVPDHGTSVTLRIPLEDHRDPVSGAHEDPNR